MYLSNGNRIISEKHISIIIVMSVARTIKAVLIDLSGTLHIEDVPIPGAMDALQRLRKSNLRVKFVTNTTKESKRLLYERLKRMGFNVQENEIFTSLTAARHLVDKMGIRPLLMLADEALEDFEGVDTLNPNAVVVGLAPSQFNYDKLNDAFRLLVGGAQLIAINKGRYYQRNDGLALAAGPFVAALEYATNSKAKVVGKPEPAFFLSGLESLNCLAKEAVMIGDDALDDVLGAQSIGMVGMLVKTGKYREGDEARIQNGPDNVFADFPEAVDYILKTFS